jgi:hypothetical protein
MSIMAQGDQSRLRGAYDDEINLRDLLDKEERPSIVAHSRSAAAHTCW